jgi:hypothetical protein
MLGIDMSAQRQSPTAITWCYPLGSPSPRFTRVNNYTRQLGWRYDALSPAVKASWQAASDNYPWLGYCLDQIYDLPDEGYHSQGGLAVYNVVNTANLDNGLAVQDVAPTFATGRDSDVLVLTTDAVGLYCTWSGRPTDPTGSFYITVSTWIGNNLPGYGPAVSKSVYFASYPISYGVPVLLFLFEVPPPPPSMIQVVYFVAVGEVGAGPFFGDRLVL